MTDSPIEVLLVEDNKNDVLLLEVALSDQPSSRIVLTQVERLQQAMEWLDRSSYDLVLLDLSLPDAEGLDALKRLHAHAPKVPIVILSGDDNDPMAIEALREGAQDYLVKGEADARVLVRSVRYAIERKQAEEALRVSREQYRAFLTNSSEGIWRGELHKPMPVDLPIEEQIDWMYEESFCAECNDAYLHMMGFSSREQVVGIRSGKLFSVDNPRNRAFTRTFISNGYMLSDTEYPEITPAGESRHFSYRLNGVVENGYLLRIWGVQTDITKRKKAEEERQKTAKLWEVFMENTPAVLFMKDTEGRYLSVNRSCENLFNKDRSELVGKTDYDLFPKEIADQFREDDRSVLALGSVRQAEWTLPLEGGERIFLDHKFPLRDNDGKTYGLCSVAIDITERKQAEEVLRRSREELEREIAARTAELSDANTLLKQEIAEREQAEKEVRRLKNFYEQVLNAIPAQLAVFDTEGHYQFITPSAVSDEEMRSWMIGKTDEDYARHRNLDADFGKERRERIAQVARSKHPLEFEEAFTARDGNPYHYVRFVSPIFDDEGAVAQVLAFGIDITDRKRAEAQLQTQQQRLQKQNKVLVELARSLADDWRDLDKTVRSITQAVGRTLNVQRSSVWLYKEDGSAIECLSLFDQASPDHLCGMILAEEAYPVYFAALQEGRPLVVHDVETDPRTQALYEGYLASLGISAAVHSPILRNGRLVGVVCHGHVGNPRSWMPEEVLFAGQVANFVALALEASERWQVEQELRKSRARLAEAQRIAGLGSWEWDLADNKLTWSEEAYRIYGLDPQKDEINLEVFYSLIHPDDLPNFESAMAKALEEYIPQPVEYRIIRPDGEMRNVYADGVFVKDAAGNPVRINGTMLDLTEQKRGEEQLLFQKTLLECQGNVSLDGILVVSEEGEWIYYNRPFIDIWELPDEMVQERSSEKSLAWVASCVQDADAFRDKVAYLYTHKWEKSRDEVVFKDGRIFDRYSTPVVSAEGEYFGRVWYYRDVTEQRKAGQALRESEARFRAILETTAVGIITIDEQGTVESYNRAAEKIFGYAEEEAMGRNIKMLMETPHHEDHDGYLKHYLDTGERRIIGTGREVEARRKDGTKIYVDLSVSELYLSGRRIFTGILRDITDRKRAQEALEISNRRYENLAANVPGMIYQYALYPDGSMAFPYVSPASNEIYGVAPEDAMRDAGLLFQGTHPDEVESMMTSIQASAQTLTPWFWEGRIYVDGKLKWVQGHSKPEQQADGTILWDGLVVDITERKKAEETLRMHSQVLDSMLEGVVVTDEAGRIIYTNPAEDAMFGYEDGELIGQHFDVLINSTREGEEALTFTALQEMPQNGGWRGDLANRKKDGVLFITSAQIGRLVMEGKPHWVCVQQDITEKQKLGALLNETQSIASIGAWEVNLITNDLVWTDEVYRIHEIPVGTPVDVESAINYYHPDSRPLIRSAVEEGIETGEPWDLELKLLTRTGRAIWVRAIGKAEVYDGVPYRLSGTFQDIDERKKAQEAMQLTQFSVDTAADAVFWINQDGRFIYVNAEACQTLLYTEEELLTMKVRDISANLSEDYWTQTWEICGKEGSLIRETVHMRKDGSQYPVDISASYMEYEGKAYICAFARDITERKRIEQLKNEFISVVSHELRTPLTSISGSLGLIAGGIAGELPVQAGTMIDIAHRNAERLVRLINDMLDIQKLEFGEMSLKTAPVELLPLLQQSLEANTGYGEKYDVQFVLREPVPLVEVNGDADRLQQVMANLLSNAAKFSPQGETVTVHVDQIADRVRVSISDRGPGIPEAFQEQIFQKFAQADTSSSRKKEGTGLGLNICKSIIEMHGGTLDFDTTPGEGTTFYFELDVLSEYLTTETPVPDTAGRPSILVCEDDPDVSRVLCTILEEAGYQADIAYTAEQARQCVSEKDYAAITLDLLLPDESGIKLIREWRASDVHRAIPIIVVSAKAGETRSDLNPGALEVVDWLDKPIKGNRLRDAVRRAVVRGSHERRILHIEDDADTAQVVSTILQEVAIVEQANTLQTAREKLESENYDLILLDMSLPDGRGEDVLQWVEGIVEQQIPVVIYSAQEVDEKIATEVAAALIKTQTSNRKLVQTIRSVFRDRSSGKPRTS